MSHLDPIGREINGNERGAAPALHPASAPEEEQRSLTQQAVLLPTPTDRGLRYSTRVATDSKSWKVDSRDLLETSTIHVKIADPDCSLHPNHRPLYHGPISLESTILFWTKSFPSC